MLLRIRHGENIMPVGVGSELLVPLRLPKAATDAMDRGKALEVADGDFVGSDAHDATVCLMQVMDVECTTSGHDGQLERDSGESRMPWSW